MKVAMMTTLSPSDGIILRNSVRVICLSTSILAFPSTPTWAQVRANGTHVTVPSDTIIDTTDDGLAGIGILILNDGTVTASGPISITTAGDSAIGVLSDNGGSATTISAATIATSGGPSSFGGSAFGLATRNGGVIAINGSDITTTGDNTAAIFSTDANSLISITSSTVATGGATSNGLHGQADGLIDANAVSLSTTGESSIGLYAVSGSMINFADGDVTTTGSNAFGVYAEEAGAVAKVYNSNIGTTGRRAHGVYAYLAGHVTLDGGSVTTQGDDATGIFAENTGTVTATGVEVTTEGGNTVGVMARYSGARIDFADGNVTTTGANAFGVYADNAGAANISNSAIKTSGLRAHGVYAYRLGRATLDGGSVTTRGDDALGILAENTGTVTATGVEVTTEGANAAGVIARYSGGSLGASTITLDSSTVKTSGLSAYGVEAANGGLVTGAGNTITTVSDGSHGLYAHGAPGLYDPGSGFIPVADADKSRIELANTSITTIGVAADGANVEDEASIGLTDSRIATTGQNSAGLRARSSGLIDATRTSVATAGGSAIGLFVQSGSMINFADGDVTTTGANAFGVYAVEAGAVANISNSAIKTSGSGAHGVYAYLPGHVMLDGGSVTTQGDDALGILAENTGTVTAAGVEVTTEGANAAGVMARYSGGALGVSTVKLDNSTVKTSGSASHGIEAANGGLVTGSGNTITTASDGSHGLYAHGAPGLYDPGSGFIPVADADKSLVELADTSVTTNGAAADGAFVADQATIDLTGSSVTVNGSDAAGLHLNNGTMTIRNSKVAASAAPGTVAVRSSTQAGQTNTLEVSGSQFVADGLAIDAQGEGINKLAFRNSTVISNSNQLFETASGTTDFSADDTTLTGNIDVRETAKADFALTNGTRWTGAGNGLTNLSLDGSSKWQMTGGSSVNTLVNNGTINFDAASPYKTLSVATDYVSSNGFLNINTKLEDDFSETDRLWVGGNTAGATKLTARNAGGTGAQTVEGIKVIEVRGNSDAAFSLIGDTVFDGDAAVVGGAYAYRLYQGGVSTPADGNWYLRSTLMDQPPGPDPDPQPEPEPLYQPGVPTYEAYPHALLGMNGLPTLQERIGNRFWNNAGNTILAQGADALENSYATPEEAGSSVQGRGFWGRVEGTHSKFDSGISTAGVNYDLNTFRMQIGLDGILLEHHNGTLVGSLSAHYVHGETKTTWDNGINGYGDGEILTDGYGFGGALTWFNDNGFYVDNQAQFTWYDSDLSAVPGHQLSGGNSAFGYALSMESGKQIVMDRNWSVTPQGQLVFSNVDFDSFNDLFGARVEQDRSNSLQGRLGLRLSHQNSWYATQGTLERTYLYGITNLYYEFLEGTKVNVSNTSFANSHDRFWGGLGLGGSYNWNDDKYSIYGEGVVSTSLENLGDSYSIKGGLGLRIKW